MKRLIPQLKVFKIISILALILVLVLTPCGIKQSMKQIFNIENLSSHNIKSSSYCQYISLTTTQKSQSVAIKKENSKLSFLKFSSEVLVTQSKSNFFFKVRSVPLYILYQQLRYSLI
ncbi:hypothetical protein [Chryseobacterium sp. T1]